MKRIIYPIFVLLMLALNIVLFFHYHQYKNKVSSYLQTAQKETEKNLTIKDNIEASILCNSTVLGQITYKDINNNNYNLSNLLEVKTNKFFICRFSEFDCEVCIKHAIETLKNKAEKIEGNNIIFLCSFKNNEMLSKMIDHYQLNTYMVFNTDSTITPIDDWRKPYYFVLDSNSTISDIMIPGKNHNKFIEMYFNNIRDKHFTN